MKRTSIAVLLVLFLLGHWVAVAQTARDPVTVIEIRGVINPLSAQYLERTLQLARQDRAQAVVIVLDTPGGLETAMREMVQALMASPVPTVVYVAPQGARATSAGLFIALAADVAAMAPATHIGAAHPVPLGSEASEVMDEKIISDAAALARSLAESHGRNVEWAERAVRESLSVTAEEAVALGVVELMAEDLDDLLAQIDGREVETGQGSVTLQTQGAPVERRPMNFIERLLHVITDPNIAFLLLSLGTLFLLAELADPGLSVAGIGSVVSFVLAFVALGSLPVNWAGVGLLALSVVLFVAGLLTDTEAVLTVGGLVPFVLGGLLLFSPFTITSPAMPSLRVSPWLIGGVGVTLLAFSMVVLRAIISAARMPPKSGAERLIGEQGTALTDLTPDGHVRVDLQDWSAIATRGEIRAGDAVEVVGVSGVRLEVVPAQVEKDGSEDKGGV
ncbi:MAG TPA: nodulation protein NfeD [Anaerolineae bacterium]|nr:nodulation protein NfeD [Anaerolineae bacterium]